MLVLIRNSKGELVWYLPSFNCTSGLVTPEEVFDNPKSEKTKAFLNKSLEGI